MGNASGLNEYWLDLLHQYSFKPDAFPITQPAAKPYAKVQLL